MDIVDIFGFQSGLLNVDLAVAFSARILSSLPPSRIIKVGSLFAGVSQVSTVLGESECLSH